MPSRQLLLATLIASFALAGCANLLVAPPSLDTGRAVRVKDAVRARTVALIVKGPASLASGGTILSDAGAGVISAGAGNVISAGGGNVVSAGAGNYVTLPSFRVAASSDNHVPVSDAQVKLVGLDGKEFDGKVLRSNTKGELSISLPDGRTLSAEARFSVEGKAYRMATLLSADEAGGNVLIDPIHTMVEARVRELAGGAKNVSAINFEKLKRVWIICDKAGIDVGPEELKNDKSADVLTKLWTEALDSKLTNAEEKAEIKSFMDEIKTVIAQN